MGGLILYIESKKFSENASKKIKHLPYENANKTVKIVLNLPLKNMSDDYAGFNTHNFTFHGVEREALISGSSKNIL